MDDTISFGRYHLLILGRTGWAMLSSRLGENELGDTIFPAGVNYSAAGIPTLGPSFVVDLFIACTQRALSTRGRSSTRGARVAR